MSNRDDYRQIIDWLGYDPYAPAIHPKVARFLYHQAELPLPDYLIPRISINTDPLSETSFGYRKIMDRLWGQMGDGYNPLRKFTSEGSQLGNTYRLTQRLFKEIERSLFHTEE